MNTKRADLALRLALILVGLGSMVLFVFVATATEAWPAASRLAMLLVPAGMALAALIAAAELREPFEERTRYGARRRGTAGAIPIGDDIGKRSGRLPASPAPSAPEMGFGIRRRNTIVALSLTAATTAVLAPVALDALRRPDVSETGFVAIVMLAPSLFYLVRSIVRVMTSSRAIRLDGEHLTLGVALGFVPPLQLRHDELGAVVDARGSTDSVHFVVDPMTGYRVRTSHLQDVDALLAALEARWPDVPIVTTRQRHDPAPSFAELAPPTVSQAPGSGGQPGDIFTPSAAGRTTSEVGTPPPADRIRMARRVLRRRTWLAGAAFLVVFVGLFAASWWYLLQRSANDQLLEEGTVIPATVIDVDRTARGPDSIDVAFDHDGVEYVRTIQSGFFSRFSPELDGNEVFVYFDPENANLVRLADRRNIHEATWIALLGAVAGGLLGSLALARTLHDRLTLTTARWSRRRIHAIPRSGTKPATIVLESGADGRPPVMLRGATGLGKRSLAYVPSWLGFSRRTVVVLPDAPDRVLLTATLTREQRETMAAESP